MISRNDDRGFFAAHWDWLVAGAGALALVGGVAFYVMAAGVDPEESAQETLEELKAGASRGGAAQKLDMTGFVAALKGIRNPDRLSPVPGDAASFLASEKRVFCEQGDAADEKKACGKPIPAGLETCPFCGAKQPADVATVLDVDGDGLPDAWESEHGLDPTVADANLDADSDGFTNAEEYAAGTDPQDAASHPDYLDSLRLVAPLKETVMPFYFEKVSPLPGNGWRFFFKDPSKRNGYGQLGVTYMVLVDEDIGKSGFVARGYEQKSRKQAIAGTKDKKTGAVQEKDVDVSVATLVRKADGKVVTMVVNDRRVPVDVQATLVFDRDGGKEFVVVPGDDVTLYGTKYQVAEIKTVGKTAKVTLENKELKVRKTLEALEQ